MWSFQAHLFYPKVEQMMKDPWKVLLLALPVVSSVIVIVLTIFYQKDDGRNSPEKYVSDNNDVQRDDDKETFSPCFENMEDLDMDAPVDEKTTLANIGQKNKKKKQQHGTNSVKPTRVHTVAFSETVKNLGPLFSKADNEESSMDLDELRSLKEILEGVTIPSRRLNVASGPVGITTPQQQQQLNDSMKRHDIRVYPDGIYPDDLKCFYKAEKQKLKTTAIRLVQTAIFRGDKFPIHLESCQIALQKRQFFPHGRDKDLNPVLYFRVKCLGPWEKDFDSMESALLYQIETTLQNEFRSIHNNHNNIKFTLVVWTGIPQPNNQNTNDPVPETKINNKQQKYQNHCNISIAQRLINLSLTHYPERLSKALIVPSFEFGLDAFSIQLSLLALIPSSRVRDKVIMLKDCEELKKFITEKQLADFCGGKSSMNAVLNGNS